MKIIQLEYFCAVSKCHSITKAAEQMFVTPPAISTAIREIEKEFSVSLFIHSQKYMTLTKEGELFYKKSSKLLENIRQSFSELNDIGKQAIPVRIGIPPLLSTVFFPDLTIEFNKIYPEIPVELFEYGSIRAAKLTMDDILDIALVNMNFYEIDKLNSFKIYTDDVVFCVTPEHHFANKKVIEIKDLNNEPVIMYNTDSVQNSTFGTLFESQNVKPNIIMHASQLFTIQKFLEQNNCGAFLYSSILKNMKNLIGIPIQHSIKQDIGLVWQKGKYINSRVEKFIDFAMDYAKKLDLKL